jgi:hypothetical protein
MKKNHLATLPGSIKEMPVINIMKLKFPQASLEESVTVKT